MKPLLSCDCCKQHVEILMKAFMPDFEAYKICKCGSERIDDHVTLRWLECSKTVLREE
jgi:hypothetical protein